MSWGRLGPSSSFRTWVPVTIRTTTPISCSSSSLCGYAMQFNSGLLTPLGEHSLVVGMTDDEEAAWEAQRDDDQN
jgi:hypothetical protein